MHPPPCIMEEQAREKARDTSRVSSKYINELKSDEDMQLFKCQGAGISEAWINHDCYCSTNTSVPNVYFPIYLCVEKYSKYTRNLLNTHNDIETRLYRHI